jgi:hypothetical protein
VSDIQNVIFAPQSELAEILLRRKVTQYIMIGSLKAIGQARSFFAAQFMWDGYLNTKRPGE